MANAGDNEARFCQECGSPLEPGAAFCSECGAKVDDPASAGQAPAPAASAAGAAAVDASKPGEGSTGSAGRADGGKKGSGKALIIILVIVAVVVVAAVVAFFVIRGMGPEEPASDTEITEVASSEEAANEEGLSSSSASNAEDKGSANEMSASGSSFSEELDLLEQDYIFPDSDSAYLTAADLRALSDFELYIARNEIFARHGRIFKNQDLKDHFAKKDWYRGTVSPSDFSESVFNAYEKRNIETILGIEQDRGSKYLS